MNYRFRKCPIVIEAFQLTKETRLSNENWPTWMDEAWNKDRTEVGSLHPAIVGTGDGPLLIHTLEGVMKVDFGDWIARGTSGELYPIKPDLFEKLYDEDPIGDVGVRKAMEGKFIIQVACRSEQLMGISKALRVALNTHSKLLGYCAQLEIIADELKKAGK
jgi:hypothetical protein